MTLVRRATAGGLWLNWMRDQPMTRCLKCSTNSAMFNTKHAKQHIQTEKYTNIQTHKCMWAQTRPERGKTLCFLNRKQVYRHSRNLWPRLRAVEPVVPVLCYLSDFLSQLPFGFREGERERQTDIRIRKRAREQMTARKPVLSSSCFIRGSSLLRKSNIHAPNSFLPSFPHQSWTHWKYVQKQIPKPHH